MKLIELISRLKEEAKVSSFDILKVLSQIEEKDISFYLKDNDIEIITKTVEKMEKYYLEEYPLEYLTNKVSFLGLDFYVDENVLIPRIETEDLVLLAIELIKSKKINNVLDVGTGSGVIAITIKKNLPHVNVWATDISPSALEIAKKNAKKIGVFINFKQGAFIEPIIEDLSKIELIISNPPYVETTYINKSKQLKYEPRIALDGGVDGLEFFRKLTLYSDNLKDKTLLFETNEFNSTQASKILSQIGKTKILQDSFGKERFILVSNLDWTNLKPTLFLLPLF